MNFMDTLLPRSGRSPCRWSTTDTVGDEHRATTSLAALAALLVVTDLATTRLPDRHYVAVKLAAATAALGLAVRGGAELDDLGLRPAHLGRGAGAGLVAAAAVAVGLAAGATTSAGRDAMASMSPAEEGRSAAEMAFVRIPLGTALAEELLFRSALLGLLLRRTSSRRAARWSSLAFGLWHVPPAAAAHGSGRTFGSTFPLGSGGHVLASVLATAAAGKVLAELRLRSRSVLAPVLAHLAANDLGLLGARAVAR